MPKKKIVVVENVSVVKNKNKSKNKKNKNNVGAMISKNPASNQVQQLRLQNTALMESICSIYDPFCPAALGARYSTKFPVSTVTFQSRVTVNVNTGSLGTGMLIFAPDLTAGAFIKMTGDGTTPANYSASDVNFVSTLAGASQMRIVSAGLRFIPVLPSTANKGILTVGTFNNTNYLNKTISIGSNYSDYNEYTIMNTDMEFVWVAKAQAEGAVNLNTPIATNVRTGYWDGVAIEIIGAPVSATIGVCEVITNVEFTLTADSQFSNQMTAVAKPVADYNVWESATQYMRGAASSVFQGTVRAFTNYAKGKAMSAITNALKLNPQTRPVGMVMDMVRYAGAREVD